MKNFFSLDNYKIKTKLMLIYLFCVLLPLIITNAVIIVIGNQSARTEQKIQLENSAQRLSLDFNNAVESALSASSYLTADVILKKYLSHNYESPIEYYDAFFKFSGGNIINYCYSSPYIRSIEIYTKNETIVNGSNFFKFEKAQDTEWYKEYIEQNNEAAIIAYYNNEFKATVHPRSICLVRPIDSENLLKIDIDYLLLQRAVLNESADKNIFIENGKQIIFDTRENTIGLYSPYVAFNSLEEKEEYILPINFTIGTWDIHIQPAKTSFFKQINNYAPLLLLLILCNLILPTVAISIVNRSFKNRLVLVNEHLIKAEKRQFEPIVCNEGKDEIGDLIRTHNIMSKHIKELIEEIINKNTEKQALMLSKKQAEINALQSQVNPHFLSNVLESIHMRSVLKGEDETADIMEEVASLMRHSIRWETDFITISEEMDYVESYLKVQKYRFGEKLDFVIHVFPECRQMRVPKFCIVTFVENACVHGIEEKTKGGLISVLVKQQDGKLQIVITDTGAGMEKEKLDEVHSRLENANIHDLENHSQIGVLNTYLRLGLYYEGNFEFELESEKDIGTEILVKVPIDYKPSNKLDIAGSNVLL